ncbi:MAG: hypothetical protein JRN15_07625 [Nitrososphaerota archaeon]|nr:hypothetical protein [Nitrososphaerota archaeon]
MKRVKALWSKMLISSLFVFSILLSSTAAMPTVSAQTQYIDLTPNYINLGMTTTISVTAPAAGTYTIIVQKPSGTQLSLSYNFSSAGQVKTDIFGNSTVGFKGVVDQVGTYNVFLKQGNTVVSANSFLVTNKILITFNMLEAGLCIFVPSGTRGEPMLAQFHVTYASNGATVENFNQTGATVTYTLPDGTVATAKLHKNSSTTWQQPWYQGHVWPSWNSSWVGNYYPSVNASDQYGNVGTYKYSGYPFPISPATLSTTIQVTDAKTGRLITGLYNGEVANITANIQYLQTVDPVPGFNGPLDAVTRGGVVTVELGWGPYNTTTDTFGNSKSPGGIIATVPMTYSGTTKEWTGALNVGTLPKLVNASSYEIVVSSHDKASPTNTGFSMLNLPAAQQIAANPASDVVTTTATSVSTTFFVAVSTSLRTISSVPMWAYAGMVIVVLVALVIMGFTVGYLLRKKSQV